MQHALGILDLDALKFSNHSYTILYVVYLSNLVKPDLFFM